jgi:D-alanyl-D-alanine carboxypeptidase/D-alanyl-D-alanine-endopeptidase (penicillin-binding protein 4)
MISILERFKSHAGLLTPKDGHPVRSGTLTGVYNYAGYIKTTGGLRSFVIMLNQQNNHRDAILTLLASF